MSLSYSWYEFREDVKLAEPFLERVVESGDKLKKDLEGRLKGFGRSGVLLEIGSTNPERLTTISDPKVRGAVYPCDFDIVLVLNEELCEKEMDGLLDCLLPDGTNSRMDGYRVRNSHQDGFPVHLVLFSEEDAKNSAPVTYSQKHALFTKEQIFNIRALRLWMMRNGAYGGFTDGFKGIAIEQMVYQHGYFDDVMGLLANAAGSMVSPEIADPVGQGNLVKRVQSSIWSRAYGGAKMYSERGLIKASPFGIESWDETHLGCLNLMRRSDFYHPRGAFARSKRLVMRALRSLKSFRSTQQEFWNADVLVVSYDDGHDVFISVDLPQSTDVRGEYVADLMCRWYKPGAVGNSRHVF